MAAQCTCTLSSFGKTRNAHGSNDKGATGAPLRSVAERTGLEPATSGVTGQHSNQLNYRSALSGGCCRDRTYDHRLVRATLYR